jgi:hypothetical protein
MYRQILQHHPDMPSSLLGLSKSLIGMNRGAEALDILRHFPPSRQYAQAQTILTVGRSTGSQSARCASSKRVIWMLPSATAFD